MENDRCGSRSQGLGLSRGICYDRFVESSSLRIVGVVCGLMLCILMVQAVLPESALPVPPPTLPTGTCLGQPIVVDYAYSGWLQPHACKVQCADDDPRYILYTDGRATQCQRPPGCNDEGEDKGIFCDPPTQSPDVERLERQ